MAISVARPSYIVFSYFSISLSHKGPPRKPKLIEQGVTIFTKLNDLNTEKSQPSGDLNPKQSLIDSARILLCIAIRYTMILSCTCINIYHAVLHGYWVFIGLEGETKFTQSCCGASN